jgi:hypothetical protein
VVHRTPQRIRIKIRRWERQHDKFAALRQVLEQRPGVVSVRVNALVASVVIHCRDGFEIASARRCFEGLDLVIPASYSPAGLRARQIATVQHIRNRSESSIVLVGLVVKLTIAIATRRLDILIKELILEAAVHVLVRPLCRKLIQSPRLETPRALLVAAAE